MIYLPFEQSGWSVGYNHGRIIIAERISTRQLITQADWDFGLYICMYCYFSNKRHPNLDGLLGMHKFFRSNKQRLCGSQLFLGGAYFN